MAKIDTTNKGLAATITNGSGTSRLDASLAESTLRQVLNLAFEALTQVEKLQLTVEALSTLREDLYNKIQEETNRATEAESSLQETIFAEKLARQVAEELLTQQIIDESTRAQEIEATILEGLAQLKNELEAEKTRAETAESELGDSINSLETKLQNEVKRSTETDNDLEFRLSKIEIVVPDQVYEPDNKLADRTFVTNAIEQHAARFIVPNVTTDMATYLDTENVLESIWKSLDTIKAAASWKYAGETVSKLTNNDYAVFEQVYRGSGESVAQMEFWRAVYQINSETGNGEWYAQYKIGSALTPEQQAALDSGVTAQKITDIEERIENVKQDSTSKTDILEKNLNIEIKDRKEADTGLDERIKDLESVDEVSEDIIKAMF